MQTATAKQFCPRIVHLKRPKGHNQATFFVCPRLYLLLCLFLCLFLFRLCLAVIRFLAMLAQEVPVMQRLADGAGICI